MNAVHFDWESPPSKLLLQGNDVHLWRADLNWLASSLEVGSMLLSEDEISRANRFLQVKHRNHFIAGRAILRSILSQYLQCHPKALKFATTKLGKPYLLNNHADLQFNLSHSAGKALYAVALDVVVGVDIESLGREVDHAELAKRYFAPLEFAALKKLPPAKQVRRFFELWTCKEAYLKAEGVGLSEHLSSVIIDPDVTPSHLQSVNGDSMASASWLLRTISSGSGYVAALALPRRVNNIHCYEWTDFFLQS